MSLRRILLLGLVLATSAATLPARAFCRTSSCELGEDDRNMTCARDEHNCVTEGNPLHWASPCLYYAVQRDGSPKSGIDGDAFQQTVARAFEAWESAQCPGGGSPRFHAQFQGFVGCNRREAVCGGAEKNVNVMMLHDQDWPELPNVIGLTTPSGGTKSGLVIDADLEINSQDFDFSEGAAGPYALKLSDVLAHEVGHFLGLSHSDAGGALMSVHYEMVQLSPELLTADDVAAICTAYPPGKALSCPAPAAPAYDECQLALGEVPPECQLSSMTHDKSSGGCNIGGAAGDSRQSGVASALVMLGWLAARRRRARAAR
jgi:hypothetical protein